jgi:formylglycine-generating enzyme required for sulfatase activity
VENIGNSNDSTGYGGVNYVYEIGKYLVTNCEYVEFLNAVAVTDTYMLYDNRMASGSPFGGAGITRSGISGSYSYSVKANMGNKPVVYVSWFNAARYCNWLHNNKPTGAQTNSTTEDGAYLLNGAITGNAVAKNSNAKYHIPTENEWYKAAYYSPIKGGIGNPGYYAYATQSDVAPTCVSANSVGDGNARTSDYLCS